MIVKQRKVPLTILKLRALVRRLPPHHPKMPSIMQDLNKREAGYKGETSIDFPLSKLFGTEKSFHLPRYTVVGPIPFFQMDTLIVTFAI